MGNDKSLQHAKDHLIEMMTIVMADLNDFDQPPRSSPKPAPKKTESWRCAKCTFINPLASAKKGCEMCGTPRSNPGPQPPRHRQERRAKRPSTPPPLPSMDDGPARPSRRSERRAESPPRPPPKSGSQSVKPKPWSCTVSWCQSDNPPTEMVCRLCTTPRPRQRKSWVCPRDHRNGAKNDKCSK